jgi:hypothetical protein
MLSNKGGKTMKEISESLTVAIGVMLGLFMFSGINHYRTDQQDAPLHYTLVDIKDEEAIYVLEENGDHYLLFASDKTKYPYHLVLVDCLPDRRIHEYAEADVDKDGRTFNFQVTDITIPYLDGSIFDRACKIIGTTPSKTITEIRS